MRGLATSWRAIRVQTLFTADAIFSAAVGVALLGGAAPLADAMGVHPAVSMPLGAGFLGHAGVYRWAARRRNLSGRLARLLGADEVVNFALGAIVIGIWTPQLSTVGQVLIAGAAVVYLELGLAQLMAARRHARSAGAAVAEVAA